MTTIGLIGYGALGTQIEEMMKQYGDTEYSFLYYDDIAAEKGISGAHGFREYVNANSNVEFIVALGYRHLQTKKTIIKDLIGSGKKLHTFVHPTAFVNKTAKIGQGVVIYPMSNIDTGVTIGNGCLLNNSVVVSHDSIIEECCFLAPAVALSGQVNIGSCTFIGTNSCVANGITIGEGCTIGIGTSVTTSVAPQKTAIGNPMHIVDNGITLV